MFASKPKKTDTLSSPALPISTKRATEGGATSTSIPSRKRASQRNPLSLVKATSNNNVNTRASLAGRQRLATAPKNLPARMMPGASQLSLNTKQKIRARPQEYAHSAAASFQEITRLISLNDEQKQFIVKLQTEIKTLKIVNARQERGLQTMDRDNDDFPKLFKNMNEELRVARMERQRAMEKVLVLEKQALSRSAEHHRQQTKIKELKEKLRKNTNPDFEALNRDLQDKNQQLDAANTKLTELSTQIKSLTAERNREITFAKQKNSKLSKELDDAKNETLRLTNALKEKERTVNTLNMYSRRSNKSESEDEGTNTSYKTGKSKKMHKERLHPIADDYRSGAEATPIVPVSIARPESAPKAAKSRSHSVSMKMNTATEESSHQRVASNPAIINAISREATPAKSVPHLASQHLQVQAESSAHQRVASAKSVRAVTPSGNPGAAQYSFFKPNLKTKSVTSDTPMSDGGEYSDDFHNDEHGK